MKPIVDYRLFDGAIEVYIFGKKTSDFDLESVHIAQIARKLDVREILWPDTHTFNALVLEPVGSNQCQTTDGVTICRGFVADGTVIPLGQAACFRTADCPTIIAHHDFTHEVIAAHAGRESLIDEGGWKLAHPYRKNESIVDSVLQRLLKYDRFKKRVRDIEIFSCCGVGANNFRHSTAFGHQHSKDNFLRNQYIATNYGDDCFLDNDVDEGALDLHRLIAKQCESYCLPLDNIHHDAIDTARDRDWFFSRRGGDKTGSNTILVIRRA